jgi:D-alanine-D-alanine ligase
VIVILHEDLSSDARADELDALVQAREIGAALERLRVPVTKQAIGLDLASGLEALRGLEPACVFNLVESLGGRGELIAVVPRLLAAAGIPYTGSGADALQLSSHKTVAKRLMAAAGIPTPEWLEDGDDAPRTDDGGRWIVKSVWEHASFGLDDASVVPGRQAARQLIRQRAAELGGEWFAERYVEGREFNLSLIERHGEPEVLPAAEMTFVGWPAGRPRIVGYAAKWDESAPDYHATRRVYPRLAPRLRDTLRDVALSCWRLFRLSGYARVDIRLDERQVPWVLEVNANPCLASDAGFAAAASQAGIGYDRMAALVLEAALPAESVYARRIVL